MFTIKWNNGMNDYRTTYYQTEEFDEETNTKYENYGFVSYSTPICKVRYYHDLTTNKDGYHVYVNRESFNCSSSTIHQLVRFLRIAMGDLFTYQDIKWHDEHTGGNCIHIMSYLPITLWWVNESIMRNTMASVHDAWYVTERV